jgi:hypothetical protein
MQAGPMGKIHREDIDWAEQGSKEYSNFILVNARLWQGLARGGLTFPGCLSCGPEARVWGSKSIGWAIPIPGG